MNETLQNTSPCVSEPCPAGWPPPLTTALPSLRWEDAVAVYLAYCATMWDERTRKLERHHHVAVYLA